MRERVTAKIDLDKVVANYRSIQQRVGQSVEVMGIVKANAYGHGMLPIAKELQKEGISGFGIAIVEEGVFLRRRGIERPILVLGATDSHHFKKAIAHQLTLTIYSYQSAVELNQIAIECDQQASIHIKIDTGMGRLGFRPSQSSIEQIKAIAELPFIKINGVYTHFSKADEADKHYTEEQRAHFNRFCEQLVVAGLDLPKRHAANSAAIVDLPVAYYDSVRAGLLLYGLYPSEEVKQSNLKLSPALSLTSYLAFIKQVATDQLISYGGIYRTSRPTRIGTVPIGYADGYSRALSNRGRVLVNGHYAPIIGRVCMDQLMIDLTDIPEAKIDDEVVLIGQQAERQITVEELAELCGTINYEIICGLGERVTKDYYRHGCKVYTVNYLQSLEKGMADY